MCTYVCKQDTSSGDVSVISNSCFVIFFITVNLKAKIIVKIEGLYNQTGTHTHTSLINEHAYNKDRICALKTGSEIRLILDQFPAAQKSFLPAE